MRKTGGYGRTTFAVTLGADVVPSMSLLHVLLAVRLSFRCVWAGLEQTMVQRWRRGVLVVDVAVPLLFGRPAIFVVFAVLAGTLPRSLMSLDMFCQVARTLEFLAAEFAGVNLRLSILLAASHRSKSLVVVDVDLSWSLHRRRRNLLGGESLAAGE